MSLLKVALTQRRPEARAAVLRAQIISHAFILISALAQKLAPNAKRRHDPLTAEVLYKELMLASV